MITFQSSKKKCVRPQKCKRKLIGRVMCEFESKPFIRIKGLCQQSTIDRDFVLIEPKLGEGNSLISFSCV